MKRYRIFQVDAFTTERFRGNPAGVVLNADGLTEHQMQAMARELNNSETAFVLSPAAPDHEVWVRFFTPTTEVPSCGHATIAAHYVRARENRLPACTVVQKIGAGILPVEIIPVGQGDYQIVMTQGVIEFGRVFSGDRAAEITSALGLAASDLDTRCPIQIVSTGHSKVLIGIRDRSKLNALQPDLARLTGISREIEQAKGCRAVMSVCTGAFLLHQAGLLAGKRATTHWSALSRLAGLGGVQVVQERVVKDGDIWTAAGISAGIDLALAFIESVAGEETAGKVQFGAEYYPADRRYGALHKSPQAPAYLKQERVKPAY